MNTISTYTYRQKYFQTTLQEVLKKALVAEKICTVDNSDVKRIENTYGYQPTEAITGIKGTYTVYTYKTNDDNLKVEQEVKIAEHIYDLEKVLN